MLNITPESLQPEASKHDIGKEPIAPLGAPSGVVGRERMGTAFPHKKLSRNGVPTRDFLRNIFSLLLLNYSYFPLLLFTFHARQTMCQNWTSEFAKY